MERGGAETEIKAGLSQHGFFKRGNDDCEGLIQDGLPQESREAFIWLYGHQWVGPKLQQLTSGRSCSGSNLESDRIGNETTSLVQKIKYPIGIRGSCGVIAGGIKAEGLGAERAIDEGLRHSVYRNSKYRESDSATQRNGLVPMTVCG